jgi:hypothetical protein
MKALVVLSFLGGATSLWATTVYPEGAAEVTAFRMLCVGFFVIGGLIWCSIQDRHSLDRNTTHSEKDTKSEEIVDKGEEGAESQRPFPANHPKPRGSTLTIS